MISFDVAYARILAPLTSGATELVALSIATRRVLAETLAPQHPLPPFAQVQYEGFAVRCRDARGADPGHPQELLLAGEAAAGRPWPGALPAGAALRVMTGAPLPPGADAVVALDDAEDAGDCVILRAEPTAGCGFRVPGLDLAPTTTLLPTGTWLTPARIQLAAAMGRAELRVACRPRVAIFANGDELVPAGAPLGPGQIHDSNAWGLAARVREVGGDPTLFGIVPDQRSALESILHRAAGQFDAILSTGGVSQGRYDFVSEVMDSLGVMLARDIALYPGKSPVVALIEGRPHFALPGNPCAAAVSFELFVRPALLRMQGIMEPRPRTMHAHLSEGTRVPREAHAALLARLRNHEGALWVDLLPEPGTTLVSLLAQANAIVQIPAGQEKLAAGEPVRVQLLGIGEDA